jgi:Tfp pilus assembly protein PilF
MGSGECLSQEKAFQEGGSGPYRIAGHQRVALNIKESHSTRIALALAFLSQGKVAEAESVHLEGIRLKPKNSERYESYAAFLSDVGREAEAQTMNKKARKLQRVS